jgi:hypothetical protein
MASIKRGKAAVAAEVKKMAAAPLRATAEVVA